MNHQQKQMNRREMLGCAKIARGERKYGRQEQAQKWDEVAAMRLFKLGGMCGNW